MGRESMAGDGGGPVDFGYLESFMAGDRGVVSEVLEIFVQQAEIWRPNLTADHPQWRDLAHTIKGAARGVGAHVLGDAAAKAELEGPGRLPAVHAALDEALEAIAAYRSRSQTSNS